MTTTGTTTIDDPTMRLAEVIDKEAPSERIIRALADALTADMTNRDGSRGPDHRTRVSAATKLLEYRVGRPIERVETKMDSAMSDGDALMRVLGSPALLRNVRAILDAAERAAPPTIEG